MCGICGGWASDLHIDMKLIMDMCDAIEHRGPNDAGYHVDGKFAFGMRRLSIIDLGGGHQPIHNEDDTVWVVFNGEIYNFQGIRDELEKKGHKFYTDTDTEVIVHAYEEYGYECVKCFNGMFGFAVYDARKGIYFVARDRLGIKPVNYYFKDGLFLFASEIKSMLRDGQVKRVVDPLGLYYYVGYEYTPAPYTMFKDIHKLLPGYYLVFDENNASVSVTKYWDITDFSEPSKSLGYYTENIRNLMEESVRLRLVSDVPVGVFLSGGLDSSIIVALMSKLVDEPLKTFSVGFEEKSFNELDYARHVSEHFGTDHHEIIYRVADVKTIEEIGRYMDLPVSNTSLLPTYLVSRLARTKVVVVLGGDGSDEFFGGYDRYVAHGIDRYYRAVPKAVRGGIRDAFRAVRPKKRRGGAMNSIKAFLDASDKDPDGGHVRWQMVPDADMDDAIFPKKVLEEVGDDDEFDRFMPVRMYRDACFANGLKDGIKCAMYIDQKSYLADNILSKNDFVTMANSIELRVPFLDYNVAEFAARVPVKFRINGLAKKYVLRRAFSGVIPKMIVARKKQGFLSPVNKWMGGELKDYMSGLFDDALIFRNGLVNEEYVKGLMERHAACKEDNSSRLWGMMNLELWYRNFMV